MKPQPPEKALQFLRWFCRPDYLEEVEGDLIELFEKQHEYAPRRANWSFRWQVLRHLRPDFIRAFKPLQMIRPDLIRHNLLISYRGFLRNKSAFLINLAGLSTGLACVFFIYFWLHNEWQVDKFLENDAQLFQVLQSISRPAGIEAIEATPSRLAAALQDDIPEVVAATTVIPATFNAGKGVIALGDTRLKASGKYASADFFRVFPYPLLAGAYDRLLVQKNDVVISESLAVKLFQNPENAIGKSIDWQTRSLGGPAVVSGVFASLPANATDQFDLVLNYNWYLEHFPEGGWADSSPRTFVLLRQGTTAGLLEGKVKDFLRTKDDQLAATLSLQRYSDRYLYDRFENGRPVGGRIEYVRLFVVIALIILAIACINFMNLSTAKASGRAKEVGVKKVVGASRSVLISQYLSEAMLIAALSFVLAMALVAVFLPRFNEITDKELHLSFDPAALFGLFGITLFAGFLAGAYPAFFLSGHQAVAVLKGRLKASVSELWVRKGLILSQFAVSMLLIVSVIVVYRQINLIQSGKSLGYERDQVLYFDVDQPSEAFVSDLRNIPEVLSVGGGNLTAGKQLGGTSDLKWPGKADDDQTFFSTFWLSYDLIETLGMEVAEGRSFSESFGSPYQLMLNETAIQRMGLKDPIGKSVQVGGEERQIVGIVRDFHFESFYEAVKPCVLLLAPMQYAPKLSVKIRSGAEKGTIAKLKDIYESYYPGLVFDFQFMDEDYQELYAAEKRVAVLSRYFAAMAIIISCLGLFGLAMFTADRRKKEIGIRKVLGAGVLGIVKMLTGDFTKIVLLGISVAVPVSYWLTSRWLARFTLRIDLSWWYFLVPAILVLLIAWLTVGIQTLQAARVNPVQSLKEQ